MKLFVLFKSGSFRCPYQTNLMSFRKLVKHLCLFPTRKACNDFNTEMLSYLTSEVRDIVCTDETAGTHKWNKKASEHLEKLNNDSNMTAGLEARLSLAVGARVILRRNIDTKIGLVITF